MKIEKIISEFIENNQIMTFDDLKKLRVGQDLIIISKGKVKSYRYLGEHPIYSNIVLIMNDLKVTDIGCIQRLNFDNKTFSYYKDDNYLDWLLCEKIMKDDFVDNDLEKYILNEIDQTK